MTSEKMVNRLKEKDRENDLAKCYRWILCIEQ